MSVQNTKTTGVKVFAAMLLMVTGAFQETFAHVSGTVTGPDGSTPLQGIEVTVFTPDETGLFRNYFWSTFTALDGTYAAPANGSCRVTFRDPAKVHAKEAYDNVAHVDQGTTIQVEGEENVGNINASLALAATISGTVTGPGGVSLLSEIWVTAYGWNGTWLYMAETATDSSGNYTIQGLFPGTYRIEFRDWNNGYYSTEVYNDQPNLDLGTNLVVAAGSTTTGINASLTQGAEIRGNITQSGGTTPLHGIAAEAFMKEGGVWRSKGSGTSVSGAYSITGLAAGTYRVVFSDWNLYYVGEVYDNVQDIESGLDIVVGAGAIVNGINAALDKKATLAGTVISANGSTPIGGILVTPYRLEAGVWVEQHWCTAISAANGSFLLERLNPGTFRIGFHDYAGHYLDGFWLGAQSLETATDIAVASGAAITGITNALSAASFIKGTAYSPDYVGVPDVLVAVYVRNVQSSRWDRVSYAYTDSSGSYSISGLKADTYRVEFDDSSNTYAYQVYDGMADLDSGTDVIVAADSTVNEIDAWLSRPPPSTPSVVVGFLRKSDGNYDVLFTGHPGADYVLQETSDLTLEQDDWEDYGSVFTCQPGTNSLPFSSTEPKAFIRVLWQ